MPKNLSRDRYILILHATKLHIFSKVFFHTSFRILKVSGASVATVGLSLLHAGSIAEEIKSRLRSGNACYHSVQNLLSSRFLSKNLKIKIYRTIILPVVLYGCETWSLTLREERKLKVFENMVLRIFRPRRDEVTGEWRKLHNEELNDLYSSPNIVRVINQEE